MELDKQMNPQKTLAEAQARDRAQQLPRTSLQAGSA
jgi:hypothetical protein